MKKAATAIQHQHPTQAQIAERAYQIYLKRGVQAGHELNDWMQAEYELMKLPVNKIAELSPSTPSKLNKYALVALVQAAMLFGSQGLHSVHYRV